VAVQEKQKSDKTLDKGTPGGFVREQRNDCRVSKTDADKGLRNLTLCVGARRGSVHGTPCDA